jgi:hypothetical protein
LKDKTASHLSTHVLSYFEQAFSANKPANYDFPALRETCQHTQWVEGDVYLQCGAMSAGLTTIMSQLRGCLKMALEAGTGVVLPTMPLRDSTDLTKFNFLNKNAYMPYDKWFDAEHLIEQIGRVCPQMKILHLSQVESSSVSVKNKWDINVGSAPNFRQFESYFWSGRPYRAFFNERYAELQNHDISDSGKDVSQNGITVITTASVFLIFRITDDPTQQDLKVWDDLSHLIRFRDAPREIVNRLLSLITRPFYGVHFRVESDSIWSSLENQLNVDLDALDRVWAKYGKQGEQRPLVYLACGDQTQVEKFVSAGKDRGWEVTHKWQILQSDTETLGKMNDLPFDFQGAVDLGIMIKSDFFLGITGSAFSTTVANARDVTGKYRGSSFTAYNDQNARNHLFNDGDSTSYACCL